MIDRAPLAPRWKKVARDLAGNKVRTALVVSSIALGVLAVGMIVGARGIILRSLDAAQASMAAASATLIVDPFDEDLVESVRGVPGVAEAEGRRAVPVRVEQGDRWRGMMLFALPDYRDPRINRVQPQAGAWPPPDRGVLLERASLAYLGRKIGDTLLVELPDGARRELPIAGTVHDLSQPPTTTSGRLYGYVTFDTLEWLGEPRQLDQLYLTPKREGGDRAAITRLAGEVRDQVEDAGHRVRTTLVPIPGRFWATDSVDSMLTLLGILGAVCLFMSGFLVVNTISALLAQQVKQIGVMKAIGASARQTAGIYLATVLVYGLLALVVAIPGGAFGALSLIGTATQTLNFDSLGVELPPDVLALEIAAGVLVPLLAALHPVLAGSRITVREAIGSYGLGGGALGEGLLDRGLARARFLPRPDLIALRNTFRRKGRLGLTLTTLALSGAVFVAVLSTRASMLRTIDDIFAFFSYDLQIDLAEPYPTAQVERITLGTPGVVALESWAVRAGPRVMADGSKAGQIQVVGPPPDSRLIRPTIWRGRWLLPNDENAIVLNTDVLVDNPDLALGDEVEIELDGEKTRWTIVGFARGTLTGAIGFANGAYLSRLLGDAGTTTRVRAVTARHDGASIAATVGALEERFQATDMRVGDADVIPERKALVTKNFAIITGFLMTMAVLLAAVGGLGLMGTMSINVLERTREIGVLRAVGASDVAVMRIVLVEGLTVGLISWVLAGALSLPVSWLLVAFVGSAFIHEPMAFVFAFDGLMVWLALVVVLTTIASLLPAWNATRLTVRDVLAYE